MLTIFGLVEANRQKLLPEILKLLKVSRHQSIFQGMTPESQEEEILKINSEGGVIMVAYNSGVAEGMIILRKKTPIEATLIDLVMRKDYEPRALEVMFSQAQRKMERAGMHQLFGSMEWFQSVADKNISSKLIMKK